MIKVCAQTVDLDALTNRSSEAHICGASVRGEMEAIHHDHQSCHSAKKASIYTTFAPLPSTYDHRQWKIRDPVCSPIDKPLTGRLVVGSVTTSEHRLLYVPVIFLPLFTPFSMGVNMDLCAMGALDN